MFRKFVSVLKVVGMVAATIICVFLAIVLYIVEPRNAQIRTDVAPFVPKPPAKMHTAFGNEIENGGHLHGERP